MSHTPGPFERGKFRPLSEGASISVCEITQVGEFGILAHVYRPDKSAREGEDNANLFAAAPEMRAALKDALWAIDNMAAMLNAKGIESTMADPRPAIRAVLAKAEGK